MPKSFSYHPKQGVPGITLVPEDLTSPMSMASGGFATLWRAGTHGQYAIKCFNNGGIAAATEEFQTLLALSGSSVVPQVYGLGTFVDGVEQGYAAIVEEYVDGYTLAHALKRGLLTGSTRKQVLGTQTTMSIALELARVLTVLEQAGISHRDLSANNVMLRKGCVDNHFARGVRLMLIDFGQSTSIARPSVTPSFRARLATVPYGAPEMYGGSHWKQRNSCKCDIWSFGAIIVTMLAGEYWPDEISDLTMGISSSRDLDRIAQAKREPLDLVDLMRQRGLPVGDMERRLADVVRRCTCFDPAKRPSSTAVVRLLQEIAPGNTPRTPKRVLDTQRAQDDVPAERHITPPTKPDTPGSGGPQEYGVSVTPVPNGLKVRGTTLMRYDGSQREVRIPDGITAIGAHAFGDKPFIERVLLPDSVKVIGDYAFAGCTSLRSIAIATVERLGIGAFWGCSALSSVIVREPVDAVPQYLFRECSYLQRVELPNTVQSIGREAFAGCTALAQVEIPNSVMHIGNHAFYGCMSLGRVTIPEFTQVASDAFDGAGSEPIRRGSTNEPKRMWILLTSGVFAFVLAAVVALALGVLPWQNKSSNDTDESIEDVVDARTTIADDGVCHIEANRAHMMDDGQTVNFQLYVKNRGNKRIHVGVAKAKKGETQGNLSMYVEVGKDNGGGILWFEDKGDGYIYKARLEVREENADGKVLGTYAFDSSNLAD